VALDEVLDFLCDDSHVRTEGVLCEAELDELLAC
jgi:hypothetical protein